MQCEAVPQSLLLPTPHGKGRPPWEGGAVGGRPAAMALRGGVTSRGQASLGGLVPSTDSSRLDLASRSEMPGRCLSLGCPALRHARSSQRLSSSLTPSSRPREPTSGVPTAVPKRCAHGASTSRCPATPTASCGSPAPGVRAAPPMAAAGTAPRATGWTLSAVASYLTPCARGYSPPPPLPPPPLGLGPSLPLPARPWSAITWHPRATSCSRTLRLVPLCASHLSGPPLPDSLRAPLTSAPHLLSYLPH